MQARFKTTTVCLNGAPAGRIEINGQLAAVSQQQARMRADARRAAGGAGLTRQLGYGPILAPFRVTQLDVRPCRGMSPNSDFPNSATPHVAVCHGYLTIPIPHPKGLLGRVQTTSASLKPPKQRLL